MKIKQRRNLKKRRIKQFVILNHYAKYGYIRKNDVDCKYRVSIKSFPDYEHLLHENCVEYKYIFLTLHKFVSKIFCHVFIVMLELHCIPRTVFVL